MLTCVVLSVLSVCAASSELNFSYHTESDFAFHAEICGFDLGTRLRLRRAWHWHCT